MSRNDHSAVNALKSNAPENAPAAAQLWFDEALQCHRAGKLAEAHALYHKILEQNPLHADSLNLLGLIAMRAGDNATAVDLIGKAISIREDAPPFHFNIAAAYINQSKLPEAARHYERAIALNPDYAEALSNLGYVYIQQKKYDQAIERLNKAIDLNPNYAHARNNLGIALKEQGKFDEAIPCFEKALQLKPDFIQAHNNLGLILRYQRKPAEAIEHYMIALGHNPNYIEARNNLGNALRDLGKLEEAKAEFERVIHLKPDTHEAQSNLGNVYKDLGQHELAIAHYNKAIEANPNFATAYFNVATSKHETRHLDEAMACYERALAIQPDYGDALWNQSLLLLLKGDYEKGWKQYEQRWLKKDMPFHGYDKPLWDGARFDGKTILLHGEQGLGDSLQFIRYAKPVKRQGGKVIVVCPPTLQRIFESIEEIDQVVPEGAPIPDYDLQAPLLSLPMIFKTTLETIPAEVPYLSAPQDLMNAWAERLRPYTNLKVGLVWAGNPRKFHAESHAIDRRRSMTLEQFAPLANIPNVTLFSLQKGEPAQQAKNPPHGMTLIDFMDEIDDFAGTAALIANIDLIVSVDTSVVHMAGALAKPVWMLSRFDGCWRWLLDRDDSPWYPTMRLFRQTKAGEWQPVIKDVQKALAKFVLKTE